MLSNARLYSSNLTKRLNWLRVTVDSADLQTASPFQIVGAAQLKARLVNFSFVLGTARHSASADRIWRCGTWIAHWCNNMRWRCWPCLKIRDGKELNILSPCSVQVLWWQGIGSVLSTVRFVCGSSSVNVDFRFGSDCSLVELERCFHGDLLRINCN